MNPRTRTARTALAARPRRMWANDARFFNLTVGRRLRSYYYPDQIPVLVVPLDPASVEALARRLEIELWRYNEKPLNFETCRLLAAIGIKAAANGKARKP